MIIGIVGPIGAGKGTVAEYLVSKYNFTQDSFAASLKDVCSILFSWPRHMLEGNTAESRQWRETVDTWWAKELSIPEFTPRLAMQLIGTNSLRDHFNKDIWAITLKGRIKNSSNIVISDVRYKNEIEFIQKNNGKFIFVTRTDLPVWYDVAALANAGNNSSRLVMNNLYSHIHTSEWEWAGTKFDYTIKNTGTVDELKNLVDIFMKEYK